MLGSAHAHHLLKHLSPGLALFCFVLIKKSPVAQLHLDPAVINWNVRHCHLETICAVGLRLSPPKLGRGTEIHGTFRAACIDRKINSQC